MRQNATSGNLSAGFPASARAILADLARAVLAKCYKAKRYFRIYAPNFREARARASAINWPVARPVLAKCRRHN